jgi:hypothetical protein
MTNEISIPVWFKSGSMLMNRDYLPISHPESTYNYIKNTLKLIPEDYGVHKINPNHEYFNKSKEELVRLLIESEEEIQQLHCYLA